MAKLKSRPFTADFTALSDAELSQCAQRGSGAAAFLTARKQEWQKQEVRAYYLPAYI